MNKRKTKWLDKDDLNLENNKVKKSKWYIFRWEMIIVLSLALFAAMFNQIANWNYTSGDTSIDPLAHHPLYDNIAFSTVSIVITVAIAIIIGVYTEMGKFAGKYGSSIFVLVPSFVWLFSLSGDHHMIEIINQAEFLGPLIFYSILAMAGIFAILEGIKYIYLKRDVPEYKRKRIEFITNYINRFLLIMINIMIVLLLGYSLVNYGIMSLHLADVTPKMVKNDPSLKGRGHKFDSEAMIAYISVVALFFALLMVMVGLSNIFSKDIDEEVVETKEQQIEENTHSLKTVEEDNHERGPNG